MASPRYNAWVDQVKRAGGEVAVSPRGVPSALWRDGALDKKLYAKELPDEVKLGALTRTGYYYAPADIQLEVKGFTTSSDDETRRAAAQLLEQWKAQANAAVPGVGDLLSAIGETLRGFGAILLIVALLYLLVKLRK